MAIPNAKFKVWWIPQVPMNSFEVEVSSIEEGRKICEVLANYDLFQFENNVKPDFCNVGGVQISHPNFDDGGWHEIPDDADELAFLLSDIEEAANA